MNTEDFDTLIETICAQGCISVNKTINQLEKDQCPAGLSQLNSSERQSVLSELKSVMDVYGGEVCSISVASPPSKQKSPAM